MIRKINKTAIENPINSRVGAVMVGALIPPILNPHIAILEQSAKKEQNPRDFSKIIAVYLLNIFEI